MTAIRITAEVALRNRYCRHCRRIINPGERCLNVTAFHDSTNLCIGCAGNILCQLFDIPIEKLTEMRA